MKTVGAGIHAGASPVLWVDGTLPNLEERNNRRWCGIALHARKKVVGSLRQAVVPGNHNARGRMLIDVTSKQDVVVVVATQICKIYMLYMFVTKSN